MASLPCPTSQSVPPRSEHARLPLQRSPVSLPLWYETYNAQLLASFSGRFLADSILFPMETVLHRLLLQGTRTIIDNTDSGLDVVPVITRYSGAVDCCRDVLLQEGLSGFYRGLGALILQYALHGAVIKLTQLILMRMGQSSDMDKMDIETYRRQFDLPPANEARRSNQQNRPANMSDSYVVRDPRLERIHTIYK